MTARVAQVDCDIHLAPRDADELLAHVPERWRTRLGDRRRLATRAAYLPFGNPARMDAYAEDGSFPGTDPATVRRQLYAEQRLDFGLIVALPGHGPDPDLNAAVSHGINAWQAATWLSERPQRLFGSIHVPIDTIPGAVAEVEHWAQHPGFKQVLIAHDGDRPFGHPQYDPLWEAAARHGLPIAVHFNDSGRLALGATPTGRFGTYVEYHALTHPLEYAAHIVSWLCSSVFDRIPGLRFALLEGGFLWHRPVIARLTHAWEAGARPEHATRTPGEYLRDHVRFTSQPIEESERPREVAERLVLADAEHLLMFSSDYPHYDYDNPTRALPRTLDADLRERIMHRNACAFYGLPTTRP